MTDLLCAASSEVNAPRCGINAHWFSPEKDVGDPCDCGRHPRTIYDFEDDPDDSGTPVLAEAYPGAREDIEAMAEQAGGWVCEAHPDESWPHSGCGGAGMLRNDVEPGSVNP